MSDQGVPPPDAAPLPDAGVAQPGALGQAVAPLVGPGATSLTDGAIPVDVIALTHSLLRAIKNCADMAAGEESPADCDHLASAALGFAQTAITLDPSRLKDGSTPSAQRAAAPITPARPPVVDRNHDGEITGS